MENRCGAVPWSTEGACAVVPVVKQTAAPNSVLPTSGSFQGPDADREGRHSEFGVPCPHRLSEAV